MKEKRIKEKARKIPFKVYVRNTWQLYLMLLIRLFICLCSVISQ